MDETHFRLFVDTNSFLHVHDLKDRPWRKLEGLKKATRVDLMIASAVIAELDEHKISGKERRRNRARAALQLIKEASKQSDFSLVLKEKPVEVRLCLTSIDIDWAKTSGLDRGVADDRIVGEALTMGGGAIVFSHDTGPLIKARRHGLVALEPPDDWLMKAEATEAEEENRKLKKELEQARSTRPNIRFWFGWKDEPETQFRFAVPKLQPLPDNVVTRLVNRHLAVHPRSIDMRIPGIVLPGLHGNNPSSNALAYARLYDRYEKEVAEYFAKLHGRIAYEASWASVPYYLVNDSANTALGLRIEVALEEAYLNARGAKDSSFIKLPEPPKEKAFADLASIIHPNPIPFIPPHDPTGLYWAAQEGAGSEGTLEADEMRAAREMQYTVQFIAKGKLPVGGTIRLKISARNLAAPIEEAATFVIEEKGASWKDDWIRKLLPDEISTYFESEQNI